MPNVSQNNEVTQTWPIKLSYFTGTSFRYIHSTRTLFVKTSLPPASVNHLGNDQSVRHPQPDESDIEFETGMNNFRPLDTKPAVCIAISEPVIYYINFA